MKIINNIINISRHFPPAVREWSHSIYSYDFKTIQDSPQNSKSLKDLLSMYLHLIPKASNENLNFRIRKNKKTIRIANAKRKQAKQLFLSNPLIKQTSDRLNITLFTFDREKIVNNRKLFILNKELIKSTEILSNGLTKPLVSLNQSKRKRNRKTTISFLSKRHIVNYNILSNNLLKSVMFLKNKVYSLYLYGFIKWALSAFNYHTLLINKNKTVTIFSKLYSSNNTENINTKNTTMLLFKGSPFHKITTSAGIITCINVDNIIQTINLDNKYSLNNFNKDPGSLSNIQLKYINNILMAILILILNKKSNIGTMTLGNMLRYYKNKHMFMYVEKYLTQQKRVYGDLYKLYISKLKYNKLTSGIKLLLSNIYNKKITLNLINLKYLHLNSDILINAVAVKLRNKRSVLLKVFNRALKLVKLPYLIYDTKLFVDLNNANLYKSSNINIFTNNNIKNNVQDPGSSMLNNIFPYKSTDLIVNNELNSIKHVLNSIHYKWTSGIRMEGKGRLTRRFIASRSVFKYKYKGSLTNLEYLNMPGHHKYTNNIIMLRNQNKPNVQYTFSSNRRNIGVYGIKGWISNK